MISVCLLDCERGSGHCDPDRSGSCAYLLTLPFALTSSEQATCLHVILTEHHVSKCNSFESTSLKSGRTIPLIVLRLVYLHKALRASDKTAAYFEVELITAIHTNYSIIAACMPFLKPVVDSLSVGLMTNDIPMNTASDGSQPTSSSRDRFNPFAILAGRNQEYVPKRNSGWTKFPNSDYTSSVTAGAADGIEFRDLQPPELQHRMVIAQTKTTEVTREPRTPDEELNDTLSAVGHAI